MRLIWSILFLCGLMGANALAQDDYLDDRSTAESLVRSYYNAISLKQYGRAFDYFSQSPAKSFGAFAKGFADTDVVEVLTGTSNGDGAAGSVYYALPVAIRATDMKGKQTYFNGCFTVRQINAEQDSPATPLQINQAKLKPAKVDDYNIYALPTCGDAAGGDEPAPTDESVLAQATKMFIAENQDNCPNIAEVKGGLNQPQVDIFTQTQSGMDEPTTYRLYRFQCSMGAYNSAEIYYLQSGADTLQRLSFAQPELAIGYIDQDGDHTKLKSLKVNGWSANEELVNSEFDPKTKTINDLSKWRGIGDAMSVSKWQFFDGRFVLKDFSVDPTYDGEQNLEDVVKNGQVQTPYLGGN